VIADIGARAATFVRRTFGTDRYLSQMTALYAELGIEPAPIAC
jgi:hypothetical protein